MEIVKLILCILGFWAYWFIFLRPEEERKKLRQIEREKEIERQNEEHLFKIRGYKFFEFQMLKINFLEKEGLYTQALQFLEEMEARFPDYEDHKYTEWIYDRRLLITKNQTYSIQKGTYVGFNIPSNLMNQSLLPIHKIEECKQRAYSALKKYKEADNIHKKEKLEEEIKEIFIQEDKWCSDLKQIAKRGGAPSDKKYVEIKIEVFQR